MECLFEIIGKSITTILHKYF